MSALRQTFILIAHTGVLASTAWLALSTGLGTAGSIAALVVGLLPLLLGMRGLRSADRYTRQWVTIALVFYLGLGLAETIATQGGSIPAVLLLLSSTIELLLLLRTLRRRPQAYRGSAES